MKHKAKEKTWIKLEDKGFVLVNKGEIIEHVNRQLLGFEPVYDELDLNKDRIVDKKDKSIAGKVLSKKTKKKSKKSKK